MCRRRRSRAPGRRRSCRRSPCTRAASLRPGGSGRPASRCPATTRGGSHAAIKRSRDDGAAGTTNRLVRLVRLVRSSGGRATDDSAWPRAQVGRGAAALTTYAPAGVWPTGMPIGVVLASLAAEARTARIPA
eukprot:4644106-Prymnesium_polylepis.1